MDDNVRHAERRAWDADAEGSAADAEGSAADAEGSAADAGGSAADAGSLDAGAGGFDADAWGASPSWDPSDGQSLYDDDDLDAELVPQARSLFAVPD